MCENGRPAPIGNEDFQRFTQGLADAGAAALTAARAKDLDAMVEVSGTMADACAACHEIYRDKEDNADRCIP
jgi:cytochrome c556